LTKTESIVHICIDVLYFCWFIKV